MMPGPAPFLTPPPFCFCNHNFPSPFVSSSRNPCPFLSLTPLFIMPRFASFISAK